MWWKWNRSSTGGKRPCYICFHIFASHLAHCARHDELTTTPFLFSQQHEAQCAARIAFLRLHNRSSNPTWLDSKMQCASQALCCSYEDSAGTPWLFFDRLRLWQHMASIRLGRWSESTVIISGYPKSRICFWVAGQSQHPFRDSPE